MVEENLAELDFLGTFLVNKLKFYLARFAFEFGKLKHMPATGPKIKRKSA